MACVPHPESGSAGPHPQLKVRTEKKRPPEGGPSTFFRCKTGASTQAPKWCAKYPVFCQRIQPIKNSQLIAISAKTLPASAHTGHFLRARTREKTFNCRNKDIDTSCLDNACIAASASKCLHMHGADTQKAFPKQCIYERNAQILFGFCMRRFKTVHPDKIGTIRKHGDKGL